METADYCMLYKKKWIVFYSLLWSIYKMYYFEYKVNNEPVSYGMMNYFDPYELTRNINNKKILPTADKEIILSHFLYKCIVFIRRRTNTMTPNIKQFQVKIVEPYTLLYQMYHCSDKPKIILEYIDKCPQNKPYYICRYKYSDNIYFTLSDTLDYDIDDGDSSSDYYPGEDDDSISIDDDSNTVDAVYEDSSSVDAVYEDDEDSSSDYCPEDDEDLYDTDEE